MDSTLLPILTNQLSGLMLRLAAQAPPWTQLPPLAVALIVFLLRTVDLTIDTLRVTSVARGRRGMVWIFGFSEALTFVIAISGVLATLADPLNIFAFAAGFATGTLVGIVIEEWVAPGHSLLRIVSPTLGLAIQKRLHAQGYGATYLAGTGQHGAISLILAYTPRRKIDEVKDLVLSEDPTAFMTVQHVRQLRGGWKP
jgi:uncharacterized protein YebE (UPF0316 family)